MNGKTSPSRWLDLAVRHRHWQVEQQMPELKERLEAERSAEAAESAAEHGLEAAIAARAGTLSRGVFTAEELVRHAAYARRMRDGLAEAHAQAEAARHEADVLRERAQTLLAERDAFQQRLDREAAEARTEALRQVAREHDELWLLRTPAAAVSTTRPQPSPSPDAETTGEAA